MVEIDLNKLQEKKRKKMIVSLYLDESNVNIIKRDMKKKDAKLSLSGLIDAILSDIANAITKEEKET